MGRARAVVCAEVELAKEAIEVWRQWRDGAEPSAAQRCAAVIHYAVNDAFLEG